MKSKLLPVLALTVSLGACAQGPGYYGNGGYGGGYGNGGYGAGPGEIGVNKTTGGALLGAAGGGLLGNQFGKGSGKIATTALGVLAGGFLGSQVGQSLDRADLNYAHQATQQSMATGQPYQWSNPQNGNQGTITPLRPVQTAQGGYCREFSQTISVGGRTEEGFGTACRQPDGSWRIVQ